MPAASGRRSVLIVTVFLGRSMLVEECRIVRLPRRSEERREIGPERLDELAVETRFEFALDTSTLSGCIDRIDRRGDRRLRLLAYKTSKWPMKLEEGEQPDAGAGTREHRRDRCRAVQLQSKGRLQVVRVQAHLPAPLRRRRSAVKLTDEQREILSSRHGPLRIAAGADTDKTDTLRLAIVELIERGVRPGEILCVLDSKEIGLSSDAERAAIEPVGFENSVTASGRC